MGFRLTYHTPKYLNIDVWWVGLLHYALLILIILIAWFFHRRHQPFAYRFQNAIEAFLLASNIVLLLLAAIYSALSGELEADSAALIACEVVLMATLLGSLLVAAVRGVSSWPYMSKSGGPNGRADEDDACGSTAALSLMGFPKGSSRPRSASACASKVGPSRSWGTSSRPWARCSTARKP